METVLLCLVILQSLIDVYMYIEYPIHVYMNPVKLSLEAGW